jgi:hypothetical protein
VGGAFITVGYLVAEQDSDRAIKIVTNKIAKHADEVVAVCRVSEDLLNALHIPPGEFMRADPHTFHKHTADADAERPARPVQELDPRA